MFPIIRQNNLVFYCPYGSDYTDRSANPVTGTATGSPTFGAGKIGNAMLLDAINESISYGTASKLNIANNAAITIMAWVFLNDATDGAISHGIYYNFNDTDARGTLLRVRPGNGSLPNYVQVMHCTNPGTVGIYTLNSNSGIAHGKWVNLAVSIGAGQFSTRTKGIYINSVIETVYNYTGNDGADATYTTNNKIVGTYNGANNTYIQHLAVWNTALTAQEIRFLYESTKGAYL